MVRKNTMRDVEACFLRKTLHLTHFSLRHFRTNMNVPEELTFRRVVDEQLMRQLVKLSKIMKKHAR